LNVHKDTLNLIGSHQFSLETGQPLVHFYSEDTLSSKDRDGPDRKAYQRLPKQKAPVLTDEIQQHLWDLPHCSLVNDRDFPGVEISYPYPYPREPLPLARGTGFPGVRGRVFVIWGGGGEHHHGTCNSHPPGYSFGESIL